ncbi:MAG: ABC transporter ATP-binding protein [Deltaproteobacteria bacterium]|nr:ABC transporter ATP-binding protein [Deltaproteobacteria bacterium]
MELPILQLQDVDYIYLDKFPALANINLDVNSGERVCILGANGSGKSTLLKILNAIAFPSNGIVKAFGQSLKENILEGGEFSRYFRQRVGFVFQDPDVQLFSATVEDEIAFGPLQLDIAKDEVEKRVDDLLQMLGIAALKHRPPYSISGGEKKKVAIASVLANNPDVLLLDEPTNGLDPRTQVWLIELLEGLSDAGKTIIIATHDLSLAADISDRVVVLNEGHKIAADGNTMDILGNRKLLLEVNLIHEHAHRHGETVHVHSHGPFADHEHEKEK